MDPGSEKIRRKNDRRPWESAGNGGRVDARSEPFPNFLRLSRFRPDEHGPVLAARILRNRAKAQVSDCVRV